MIKISILIATLEERKNELTILLLNLMKQCKDFTFKGSVIDRQGDLVITTHTFEDVEIITAMDNRNFTTGYKRNILYQMAKGRYSASIDDDDSVPNYYVEELLKAAKEGTDCFAINGSITFNGKDEKKWYISKDLKYEAVGVGKDMYYNRYPNHITGIRSEIAKQFLFPDKTIFEDFEWATKIHNSGLIKIETKIEKPMYYYKYSTKTPINV